jgi:LysM repeat protein
VFHLLEKHDMLSRPIVFAHHKVKRGETLRTVAKLYKSSRRAIRRFNQLKGDTLEVGRTYAVPYQGKLERQDEPTPVPPRVLP